MKTRPVGGSIPNGCADLLAWSGARPGSKNRSPDADVRRAARDGHFEIAAHAHGEHRQGTELFGEPIAQRAKPLEVRPAGLGIVRRRRHRHEAVELHVRNGRDRPTQLEYLLLANAAFGLLAADVD